MANYERLLRPMRTTKCDVLKFVAVSYTITGLAIVEHVLAVNYKLTFLMNCKNETTLSLEIVLLYVRFYTSHLFRYVQVDLWKAFVYKKSVNWPELRVHYSYLTQMLNDINSHISLLILLSFFTNIFYLCLQLFYATNRLYSQREGCPQEDVISSVDSAEYTAYYVFSFFFLLMRSTITSLAAVSVHTEAMKPLRALRRVATEEYTLEVQRFIRQIRYIEPALNDIDKLKQHCRCDFDNQQSAFRRSTSAFIIVGQCIGLNPVSGALGNDVSEIRLKIMSFKHLYSLALCFLQLVLVLLCFVDLAKKSITLTALAYLSFYATTFMTTVLFLRLAKRWQSLNRELTESRLDEYVDPYMHCKCATVTIICMSLALFEHSLALLTRLSHVTDCNTNIQDILRMYTEQYFEWLFYTNFQYNTFIGVFNVILNILCNLTWNYSHVFIICISLYLSSILEHINKKLVSTEGQFRPPSFWRSLREDYSNATRLIHVFDDNINGIIFVAFASNLFFICLQLFFVLSPFGGLENVVYMTFSLVFVLSRSLAVSLIAARVHSATLLAAPVLYAVPSPVYCVEVQRFIEQVHGDNVALTGMNFFHITRELVLSRTAPLVRCAALRRVIATEQRIVCHTCVALTLRQRNASGHARRRSCVSVQPLQWIDTNVFFCCFYYGTAEINVEIIEDSGYLL
ncbi:unnamed protein product [Leptosia nina]|uniref:Gustatory receptor n=1 Tax=Leptosia nina TaxID=320188 RepID=A0AAV1JJ50_9NEOP